MHELSVAQNIIDIVKENVSENDIGNVRTIFLEIGEFSGIIPDSLQYCFDIIKSDANLENSKMEIKKIPFVLFCNDCSAETTNNVGIRFCDKCGSYNTKIISGTDMQIIKIELDS